MILVKEKIQKNGFIKKINRIYINTLVPQFQFRNKKGEMVKPNNICIHL